MSEISHAERLAWLRLARADQVGPVTFAHLIGRFGAAQKALAALPDLARRGGRTGPLPIPDLASAEAELAAGEALGARLVLNRETGFPRLLAVLDPPPPLIWVKGDLTLTARRTVAIVGARSASAAGQRFARALAAALGEAGYVVISGLARGIDAAAHGGALATGTIAVIAGGVDIAYPPENEGLHDQIGRQGLLVSDRAIGHVARAPDFPRRNRLISGLAMGVVVVEAEIRSGSLITARLAGEQGRDVFAVPGSPLDPRSRGANDLIRQGAFLVEEADDVLKVLDAQASVAERDPPSFSDEPLKGGASNDGLGEILETLLSPTPTSFDELARAAGAPVSSVAAALVEMAVAGKVELLAGGLAVRP